MQPFFRIMILLTGIFLFIGCKTDKYNNVVHQCRKPVIEPDFSGVTIPRNIAPLNFIICEKGDVFKVTVKSAGSIQQTIKITDGVVRFPLKSWKKILANSQGGNIEIEVFSEDNDGKVSKYDPIKIYVANEPIDPYICYRLLFPGYQSWSEMKIIQRSLENFSESSVFENQLVDNNCVNCHTFIQNDPEKFLVHVRGTRDGTYFADGEEVIRRDLRVGDMTNNAVYPAWHPSGEYIVFSSNEIIQAYNLNPENKILVYDQKSPLVFYTVEKNEMHPLTDNDTAKYMNTFPFWAPAGDYLYYCRTKLLEENFDYKKIKYDLVRVPFDEKTGSFGPAEVIFNAHKINKSASFPAISPDGKFLVFVLLEYGTFSIWHKEADLYLLELESGKFSRMNINSDESESYHAWSSNGKWLVFSSKRGDGLTARPYFAYINSPDSTGKPFVLPQKDPSLYGRLDKTFNRPEFITGKIKAGPREFMRAAKQKPIEAIWIDPAEE